MPRESYYGIFTMLYETLRGNRNMSEYAFLSCLFWSSILVIFYSLIRKNRRFMSFARISGMLFIYVLCMLQFLMPLDARWQKQIPLVPILNPVAVAMRADLPLPWEADVTVWQGLVFIWLFGMAVSLLRFAVGHIRIHLLLKRLPVRAADIPKQVEQIIPEHTELFRCGGITVPFSFGIIRRRILIPAQAYSERDICNIIRHECAHLRKRDHLMVLVADFLCALYWWNPCVYLLKRDMERGLEMRCDREAVRGMNNEELAEYMETLISVFRNRYGRGTYRGLGMLGSGNGMRAELRERFDVLESGIGSPKRSMAEKMVLAGFACMLMLLSGSVVFVPKVMPPVEAFDDRSGIEDIEGVTDQDFNFDYYYVISEDSYIISHEDGSYSIVDEIGERDLQEIMVDDMLESGVQVIVE